MEPSANTNRALDACYDAVIVPGRWTAALDDLAHSLGAQGCAITPHDINDREYGVVWSTDIWKIQERWLRHRDWVKPPFDRAATHMCVEAMMRSSSRSSFPRRNSESRVTTMKF